VRGQDIEFNLRLKNSGGKTMLVPDIVSYYFAHSDLTSFVKHNFKNGVWAIIPFKYTQIMPVSFRHLVPLLFVSLLIFSLLIKALFGIFLVVVGIYLLTNILFSAMIAVKTKDFRLIFIMPFIFIMLHMPYGIGSLIGLCNCFFSTKFWHMRFAKATVKPCF